MGPVLAQVLPTMTGEGEGLGDGEGDLSPVHLPVQEASALQADALLPAQQPAFRAEGEGRGKKMQVGLCCSRLTDLESRKGERGSAKTHCRSWDPCWRRCCRQ